MMTRNGIAAALVCAATLAGCGAQAPRSTAAPARPAAVPILLYHQLARPPAGDPHASLWVTPARFGAHVRALAGAGFHAVTLDAVWRAWHGGAALPSRPVVITFDDGYANQDAVGRRLLATRRWPAVMNLQLNRVGVANGLSRAAVRRLIAAGWEVDDHSTTHPDLTTVSAARLRAEVAGSRATLRRTFGVRAAFFCYPYGRADPRVRRAVRAAGFLGATTTRPARATAHDDPFALPRFVIRGAMTPAQVVRLAAGG